MLRKFGIIAVLSLLALALAAVPALAVTNFDNAPSGAHYRKGYAEPVCTETTVPTTGAVTVSCTATTDRRGRQHKRGPSLVGDGHGRLRLSQSWQR